MITPRSGVRFFNKLPTNMAGFYKLESEKRKEKRLIVTDFGELTELLKNKKVTHSLSYSIVQKTIISH